jgi:hypothetical protein
MATIIIVAVIVAMWFGAFIVCLLVVGLRGAIRLSAG